MKPRHVFSCCILFGLLLTLPASATTLTELRRLEKIALANNLNLRAVTYTTMASEEAVGVGQGIYDPLSRVILDASWRKDLDNQSLLITETESSVRRAYFSLSQKLPSGGELTLNLEHRRQQTDLGIAVNPYYHTGLGFRITQPILRGYGKKITEHKIVLATYDRDVAIEDLREQAISVLTDVRHAYFEVLQFRDELASRDSSIALAEKVLKESRAKVDTGVFPPIELLEAEVGLTRREQERLDTNIAYQDALDALTLLLGPSENSFIINESLSRPNLIVDEEEGYQLALSLRPDLLRRFTEIEKIKFEQELAQNKMMPQFDLFGGYGRMALNDNSYNSLTGLFQENHPDWVLGLTISYPLGNREARHEYQQNLNRIKSQQAIMAQLREETRTDVRRAIRWIKINNTKVDVAGKGRTDRLQIFR